MKELLFRYKSNRHIKLMEKTILKECGFKKSTFIKKMIRANIPKEFWHIDLNNFDGDPKAMRLVERYCNNLKSARKNGFGFLFMGENGVGKTSLSIIILKEALKQGFTAFYVTMPEVFRQIYLGFKHTEVLIELKKYLYDVDFLVIGELGKDYHRKGSELFMISEFDSMFRERRGDLRPVVLDTNLNETELAGTYGQSLISLFRSRLKFIEVKGDDYRKKKQGREVEEFFK